MLIENFKDKDRDKEKGNKISRRIRKANENMNANGKAVDLSKGVEIIQIKSQCRQNYIMSQHHITDSKSRLCKQEEEEDYEKDVSEEENDVKWNEFGTSEIKNFNELETDIKTPNSNHLVTKEHLIFTTKQSNENQHINDNDNSKQKRKYNGLKVFQDITSYNFSSYNLIDLKEFLFQPLVKDRTLYCNIKLKTLTNTNKTNDYSYEAVIQGNDFPLIKAKKITTNSFQSLKYCVYCNRNDIIGKIKANFFSTSFDFYKVIKENNKLTQGKVQYKFNPYGLFGLRNMNIELTHSKDQVTNYTNKQAIWIKEHNEYRLDFNSRVKQASSKNFIIENNNKEKLLQFGKIDNEQYAMDFQAPLSPFQAFCICATSIITKDLCE